MEDSEDNSGSQAAVLDKPNEVQDQSDWFSRLAKKLAFVKKAEEESGTNMGAAKNEVARQIKQVSSGEPITKSGGEE